MSPTNASTLWRGAQALDCLHGPKPTGCKGKPPQLLSRLVYTLELARSPLCCLPSAWLVALDERHAKGDSSAEAVWWYALQEYTTTVGITPLRTSQLRDAVLELQRQVLDFSKPLLYACADLHRTALRQGESLTWQQDLPSRSVEFTYRGPRSIQAIAGELARAIAPLGFTWTIDYELRARIVTINSGAFFTDPPYPRPRAGKTTFMDVDYSSIERRIAQRIALQEAGDFGRLVTWGRAQAAGKSQTVADARERFASEQPRIEPEGPTARVSLATLLSLRAP